MSEDDSEIRIMLPEDEEKKKIICVGKYRVRVQPMQAKTKRKEKPVWMSDIKISGKPLHK